ncbi:hypothetical protein RJ640_029576 [Escallonia rubra]|uniref:Signal recognition particle subunit SRP72 n=1 Tax=Escallonia rubra TaxID=112253 RepID=A0AA88R605_9ASTE|nr:hypothetical protein RJ640_029576 [Escallonia rubra]
MATKGKEKPKSSAPPAVGIEDLFTSLNRHIQRSEYEQAVKVSDQILSIAPGDEDAIRCKTVALIKGDSIDEALSFIREASRKFPIDFSFLKAYCLYRLNKLDEALGSLKGNEANPATMLLESQILFRLGKMDASVEIYQKLQKSKIDSLEINVVAGLVSAGRASEVQGFMETHRVKATSSFELAYNAACALIERNKYADAEQLLLSARSMEEELIECGLLIGKAGKHFGHGKIKSIRGKEREGRSISMYGERTMPFLLALIYCAIRAVCNHAAENISMVRVGNSAVMGTKEFRPLLHVPVVVYFGCLQTRDNAILDLGVNRYGGRPESGHISTLLQFSFIFFVLISLVAFQLIGQETLMEDNLADDEIDIELAPIAVQLAYVQQLLGHTQEALKSYADFIKRNLPDESSVAVAINNLIALKGPKDISDGLRKLDRLIEKGNEQQSFQLARGLELKLSSKQREAIYINRVLLLLHSNKMDQARELVAALPQMFSDSVMPVLLQAAVLVRENKAGKAEEILGQFAAKFPDKSKIVLLARAQVAAAAGHPQIAADSLAKIPDIQHLPATVATLVSLKERAGDIDGANAVFESAIRWWSNAMTENNKLNVIMQEAAAFKLKHGRKEDAAHLYEELVKSHGNIEALVGLIQTAAHTDVEKAEAYEKKLKSLPGLKAVDVDSLEKTSGAKHVESGTLNTEPYEAKTKEKAKKKRKRKPKYPKGFDPANPGPPPDPERWLPKRERSSFRPKRKDKRTAQIRGSQGAVSKEAANAQNPKSSQTANSKAASQNAVTESSKPSSKSSRKKSRN